MSIAALQPDVNVWQYAGTEVYAWFTGTGSNSQFTLSWDYNGGSPGNLDTVYVRQNTTGTEPWEFAASRWNDQSHHVHVDVSTYGTRVNWGLQNRNGAGSEVTNSAVSEMLVRYAYITSLAVQPDGPNILVVWTTDAITPADFHGFQLWSDSGSGGAPFVKVADFDFDERDSTMGKPAGFTTNDTFYMVGVNAAHKVVTFPSDTIAQTPE